MKSRMTHLEEDMLERGYVSSRMAAYKLRQSIATVLRKCADDTFRSVRVGRLNQRFIEIASIKDVVPWHEAKLFDLEDWNDVLELREDGCVHVRSREDESV